MSIKGVVNCRDYQLCVYLIGVVYYRGCLLKEMSFIVDLYCRGCLSKGVYITMGVYYRSVFYRVFIKGFFCYMGN